MKKEKIEELFNSNSDTTLMGEKILFITDFTKAINQAELELYKKLEEKLRGALGKYSVVAAVIGYIDEIRNKIKELGNENN